MVAPPDITVTTANCCLLLRTSYSVMPLPRLSYPIYIPLSASVVIRIPGEPIEGIEDSTFYGVHIFPFWAMNKKLMNMYCMHTTLALFRSKVTTRNPAF